MTANEPVVAYSSAESAPTGRSRRGYGSERIPALHGAPERQVEFHEPTERSYPFASKRFHVLLNSLFKVLFNFPSRYLFAIGLGVVFSLTRSLPRTLGFTATATRLLPEGV